MAAAEDGADRLRRCPERSALPRVYTTAYIEDMEPISRINARTQARYRLRNMLHTFVLSAGSVALLALCAWTLAGPEGVFWAAIGGGVSLVAATRLSPQIVLNLYRARELRPDVFPEGQRIIRLLARRAGLERPPTLHYVHSRMMNAFSIGRRDDAAVCVTDGLIRGLDLREFVAVMAHEIAHIAHEDIRVMALADVVSRMTSVMSTLGLFLALFNLPAAMAGGAGVPWLTVLVLVAAPTVGTLLQLALSRAREYDADLGAVALTGDPQGLASALVKLEQAQGRMWEAMALPGARIPDPSILRSHPATEERVRRILALRREPERWIDVDGRPHTPGRSLVPAVGRPRPHLRGLGVWY